MADGNGKFKFVGSVIAGVLAIVVVIFQLVYSPLNSAQSAEAIARQSEDKVLHTAMIKGDNSNREDFLKAIKELTTEQRQDNKEIVKQLGILTTEIAVLKREIQK